MRVCVMTLTRDRIEYTQHCFGRLRELAGVPYDHFVLDQGSWDGSAEWLRNRYSPKGLCTLPDNVGVNKGLNILMDLAPGYDVYVKFDNDCEVTTEYVLLDAALLVYKNPKLLVSPQIFGLNSPPPVEREVEVDGHRVGVTGLIGGIFLAASAQMLDGYRHDENGPIWGMDDVNLCQRAQSKGGFVGYLLDHPANHYETTVGQETRYPAYWQRKMAEFNG